MYQIRASLLHTHYKVLTARGKGAHSCIRSGRPVYIRTTRCLHTLLTARKKGIAGQRHGACCADPLSTGTRLTPSNPSPRGSGRPKKSARDVQGVLSQCVQHHTSCMVQQRKSSPSGTGLKRAQGILGQYIYHHTKHRAHDPSQGLSLSSVAARGTRSIYLPPYKT